MPPDDGQCRDHGDAARLVEISSPVERAAAITAYGRRNGTLPPPLSRSRDAALIQAWHTDGHRVTWLATKVGLSHGRISQIIKRAVARTGEATA